MSSSPPAATAKAELDSPCSLSSMTETLPDASKSRHRVQEPPDQAALADGQPWSPYPEWPQPRFRRAMRAISVLPILARRLAIAFRADLVAARHHEVGLLQQRHQIHAAGRDERRLKGAQQQIGGRRGRRRQGTQPGWAECGRPEVGRCPATAAVSATSMTGRLPDQLPVPPLVSPRNAASRSSRPLPRQASMPNGSASNASAST